MHFKLHFLIISYCALLIGCSIMPNEMKTAQKIMDTNPDSALHILQKIQPAQNLSDADRALYGILLFQALDKSNKLLQPDSVINFSVNFFQEKNDKPNLALSYYYKSRLYKKAQRYDNATLLYLKALDLIQNSKEYMLLGKIYSDMGDICTIQLDYNESLKKYQQSINYFKLAGDTLNACYKIIDQGRIYRFLKNYSKAQMYYHTALIQSADSFLHGAAFQEIGINYYKANKIDSAQYFLRKSLKYPYKGTSYAIRCYILAELFFDIEKYDSSFCYATKALKYPSTFFTQRDCYRILANSEYSRGNLKELAIYMAKYQDCTDSVRKIEIQTKTSVLEDLHQTNNAFVKSKQFLVWLACFIPVLIAISLFILFRLRKRNKNKVQELEIAEEKLSEKQIILKETLIKKIAESKIIQAPVYKKSTLSQREAIDKEIYNLCLYLNDWEAFKKLMNQTFNNVITAIEKISSDVNRKDIIMCCLFLLDVPTNDMAIVLECKAGSLYKMKQRLSQKLNLSGTKELDKLLLSLSGDK